MKKSMFWLALLMMGVSTALWTGCSDDDNGPGQEEGEGDGGGNGEGNGEAVKRDTVFQIKTIKIMKVNDGDGFYKLVEFNRTGEELTGLKISDYTDQGINGTPREIVLDKKGTKIRLVEDKGGWYEKTEYSFNEKGYVTEALFYSSDEGDPWNENDETGSWGDETIYTFAYDGASGMLNKIEVPAESAVVFEATYQQDSNLLSVLMDPFSDMRGTCVNSDKLNNFSLDLNYLGVVSADFDAINFAIWCGWLPNTPNLIKSLTVVGGEDEDDDEEEAASTGTRAGEQVIVVIPGYEGDKVTTLDMKVGDIAWKKFVLSY